MFSRSREDLMLARGLVEGTYSFVVAEVIVAGATDSPVLPESQVTQDLLQD